MNAADIVALIVALFAILIAGLTACVDAALSRLTPSRLAEMTSSPSRLARLEMVVADRPRFTNTLLLVRTVAEMAAAVLATIVLLRVFPESWQAALVTIAAMTLVAFLLIGVCPRTLGLQHYQGVSLAFSGIVKGLETLLAPIVRLLILAGNAVTPGKGFRAGPFGNEADLRDLVTLAEQRQVIESEQSHMIHSVFDLGTTIAREVMVPRTDIVFIERDKTVRQTLSLLLRSGYSRIPVIGENEDDVIGVVYLKDLAARAFVGGQDASNDPVDQHMRPATFVPDSKPVDELLTEMQAARIHLAIIVDEYGGTAGLITIEDILEEIVGEITDEYDHEIAPITRIDDDRVRVNVRLPIEDLEELYDVKFGVEGVETVGGLLAAKLGKVPIPGAVIETDGLRLLAEGTQGRRNRIATVLVSRCETMTG